MGRQKWGITGSGPCLGILALSPIIFRQFPFLVSVSPSVKWVVLKREVGLSVLKVVVISSLIPRSPLPPPIVKVLSGVPWLLRVCYEVSSSVPFHSLLPGAIGLWDVFLHFYSFVET